MDKGKGENNMNQYQGIFKRYEKKYKLLRQKLNDYFIVETIPEGLDYMGVFDDLFDKYTKKHELIKVKTANMGSLYKLNYRIILKRPEEEKLLIDDLRCRNENLEISCGRVSFGSDEL